MTADLGVSDAGALALLKLLCQIPHCHRNSDEREAMLEGDRPAFCNFRYLRARLGFDQTEIDQAFVLLEAAGLIAVEPMFRHGVWYWLRQGVGIQERAA